MFETSLEIPQNTRPAVQIQLSALKSLFDGSNELRNPLKGIRDDSNKIEDH